VLDHLLVVLGPDAFAEAWAAGEWAGVDELSREVPAAR
jgi:hypothetical protein